MDDGEIRKEGAGWLFIVQVYSGYVFNRIPKVPKALATVDVG